VEVARSVGLALGVFILINLAGEAIRGPFSTLPDWISLPGPRWCEHIAALAAAIALLAHGLVALPASARRGAALLLVGGAICALVDTARFYAALSAGYFRTPAVIPASILVAAILLVLAAGMWKERDPRPPWTLRRARNALLTAAGVAVAIPLVRMMSFGPSRYDRRAEYAVVFGARVWDNGTPSDALADRVDEAIRLHQRGLVRRILMSGAVDAHNGFSEPEVMKDRAVAQGVPVAAIVLDEQGVDTASTVRNTARILGRSPEDAALVVTHYYHEPRAKMLFDRAGIRAYTVPARMSRRLLKEPYFVLREVAAYYHSFLLE
jgi:vancomycin permeability regulator SanA